GGRLRDHRRWLLGPGIAEARDHLIPTFALGAAVINGTPLTGTVPLGALRGSTVRPGAGVLVVEGGSRGRNGPALAVHGEPQLCVVGLPVAEFGTGFGVCWAAVAPRTERQVGGVVSTLVRRQALVRIVAGHDTHLECGLTRCEVVSLPFVM